MGPHPAAASPEVIAATLGRRIFSAYKFLLSPELSVMYSLGYSPMFLLACSSQSIQLP